MALETILSPDLRRKLKDNACAAASKFSKRQPRPPTGPASKRPRFSSVRKVSGMRKPSKANQAAFDAAVLEITNVTQRLLGNLNQARTRAVSSPINPSCFQRGIRVASKPETSMHPVKNHNPLS